MPNRKLRAKQKAKQGSPGIRRIVITTLVLSLIGGITAIALLANSSPLPLPEPVASPPQSPSLSLSKEYVYAGGKLVATEDSSTPGAPVTQDTIGVFHQPLVSPPPPSFKMRFSNTAGAEELVVQFGQPGDKPIVGDWNGDGTDTVGVFRNGAFILSNSPDGSTPHIVFSFGNPGDQPVAGDWNHDRVDTIGLYRNGTF